MIDEAMLEHLNIPKGPRDHAEETRQQIANVKKCFLLLGEQVNDTPSPVTKGLAKKASPQ